MCTLILATHVFEGSPVFLASNRDERLDRPAHAPFLWDADPAFVAPRDEQEGGTWLGVNACGVLVAITNRFGSARDPERRSRGALVLDALGGRSAEEAAEIAASYDAQRHNPFHLVLADTSGATTVWSDGEHVNREPLGDGVHVVTERSFGAAPNGRADFLHHAIDDLGAQEVLTPDALVSLLAVARPNDIDATTVRIPEMNYGTRSSTIVDVTGRRLRFADGPPTEVAYADYSGLMREILT